MNSKFSRSNLENLQSEINRNSINFSDKTLVTDTGNGKFVTLPLNLDGKSNVETPRFLQCKSGPAVKYRHTDTKGREYPSIYIFIGNIFAGASSAVVMDSKWINKNTNLRKLMVVDMNLENPITTTFRESGSAVNIRLVGDGIFNSSHSFIRPNGHSSKDQADIYRISVDGWVELPLPSIACPIIAAAIETTILEPTLLIASCTRAPIVDSGLHFNESVVAMALQNFASGAPTNYAGMIGDPLVIYDIKKRDEDSIVQYGTLENCINNPGDYIFYQNNNSLQFVDKYSEEQYAFHPVLLSNLSAVTSGYAWNYAFILPFNDANMPVGAKIVDYVIPSDPPMINEIPGSAPNPTNLVKQYNFQDEEIFEIINFKTAGGQNDFLIAKPNPENVNEHHVSDVQFRWLTTAQGGMWGISIQADWFSFSDIELNNFQDYNIVLYLRPRVITSFDKQGKIIPTVVVHDPIIKLLRVLPPVTNMQGVLNTLDNPACIIYGSGDLYTFKLPAAPGVTGATRIEKTGVSSRRNFGALCPEYWTRSLVVQQIAPFGDAYVTHENDGVGVNLDGYYSTRYASIKTFNNRPTSDLSGVPTELKQFGYQLYDFDYPAYPIEYIPQKKNPLGEPTFKQSSFDFVIRRKDKAVSADVESAELSDTHDSWRVSYVPGFIPDSTFQVQHRSLQINKDFVGYDSYGDYLSAQALQPYNWQTDRPNRTVNILPLGYDTTADSFYSRFSDAWSENSSYDGKGDILVRVRYADGRTELQYADLDWTAFYFGLRQKFSDISDSINGLSGEMGDMIEDLSAFSDLSGLFWIRGRGSDVNYGTSIGNYNCTTVIDLDEKKLIGNGSQWTVDCPLEVQGKLHATIDSGEAIESDGRILAHGDIYSDIGFGTNQQLFTSQNIALPTGQQTNVLATESIQPIFDQVWMIGITSLQNSLSAISNAMYALSSVADVTTSLSSLDTALNLRIDGVESSFGSTISNLSSSIGSLETNTQSISADVARLKEEIDGTGGSGGISDRLSAAISSIQAQDIQIGSLTDDLDNFHTTYNADKVHIQNELTVVNNHIYAIQDELSSINSNIYAITDEISSINGRIYSIDNELSTVNGRIYSIDNELSSTNANLYELSNQLSSVPDQLITLNDSISSMNDVVFELSNQLSSYPNNVYELSSDISSINSNIQLLLSKQNNLSSAIDNKIDRTEAYQIRDSLQTQIDDKANVSDLDDYVLKSTSSVQTLNTPINNYASISATSLAVYDNTYGSTTIKPERRVTITQPIRQVWHRPELITTRTTDNSTYTLEIPFKNGTIATTDDISSTVSSEISAALADFTIDPEKLPKLGVNSWFNCTFTPASGVTVTSAPRLYYQGNGLGYFYMDITYANAIPVGSSVTIGTLTLPAGFSIDMDQVWTTSSSFYNQFKIATNGKLTLFRYAPSGQGANSIQTLNGFIKLNNVPNNPVP